MKKNDIIKSLQVDVTNWARFQQIRQKLITLRGKNQDANKTLEHILDVYEETLKK